MSQLRHRSWSAVMVLLFAVTVLLLVAVVAIAQGGDSEVRIYQVDHSDFPEMRDLLRKHGAKYDF